MKQTSARIEMLGWLLPSALIVGGALAAASASAAVPRQGAWPGAGASAIQTARVAVPAPGTVGPVSFAFGFLEFDWDPDAPGGVPGFGPWPQHEPRVADVRAGE
jgi:hypothetical protein